ncbi:NAD(P)-binding protein [Aspergillus heteromorphus CBS 117.55]|uniref:NAD(P)-binding protein n=1 Tax=Aspergillus heteromorphus CBS 117.55 TaxID=1448321 RepID=A0A317WRS8_9EURO|nr:NAD(P)-binding protein [Aspergillus heteromorphus CBS 117.55]PWY89163.1 NAD(P)-binding protein [Aspergillus heteromorphus CBS 117.55]
MSPSLVTGGTGYIALYVIKLLLEQGHHVHTTVRSVRNSAKCKPLLDLQAKHPGKLSLFEADLLKDGSFREAMEGCTVVYHIASPFLTPSQIKDGLKECVEPALWGTRNVLESVNQCPSVRRVVLTSSMAAMYGDSIEVVQSNTGILSETCWNESSSITNNPYFYSKVVAEREAWKINEAQIRWDLVVVNPGLVLGPSLTAESVSGSLFMLENLYRGHDAMGCPGFYFLLVDVRDVAEAHLRAGTSSTAKGRYLITNGDNLSLLQMAALVRPFHHNPKVLPRRSLPKILVYAAAPFVGVSMKFVARNAGICFQADNGKSVRELGMSYRSTEEMLRDHYEEWLQNRGGK